MEETQRQKAWDTQTLKQALLSAGFRGVCVYGDSTLNPAREEDQRWHVCASRPPEED